MKKFILSVSLYLLSLAASAQSEVPTDTIHGISMDNYKIYDDGFILDMGMKIATPMRLIPPQLTYDAHSVKSSKDYYKLFQLDPNITYGKECMDSELMVSALCLLPCKVLLSNSKTDGK